MNTTQEVAKALWAARQPDDTFAPCNWVRVYAWRHNEAVIIITELEALKKIERRLDGWVIKGGKSWHLESFGEYQWEKIELAVSKVALTQEPYTEEELRIAQGSDTDPSRVRAELTGKVVRVTQDPESKITPQGWTDLSEGWVG